MKPTILFLAFLASVIVAGCKKEIITIIDGPPRLDLQSLFAINGNGSITLGWNRLVNAPPYEVVIYRGATEEFNPSSDTYMATLPSIDSSFVDSTLANGRLYYYRIVPVELLPNGLRQNGKSSNVAIGRPFDYNTVTTINYSNHIQTIFTSSCAVGGCHVGYSEGGQFSLKTWAELFEGSKDGAAVIPYKSSKSDLIFHTNNDTLIAPVAVPHMPLPGFDLPSAQISTLIRWIDQGAANDQGAVAYSSTPGGRVFVVNASEDLLAVIDMQKNLVIRYVNVGSSADSSLFFGSPHHVRVDRQGRYFYTTLINSEELWKFSASTYEFLGKVRISPSPADVKVTSSGDTVIVSHFAARSPEIVTLVNARTMQVIRTFMLPTALLGVVSFAHGVILSRDGQHLYTVNQASGNVAMITMSDGSVDVIPLPTSGAIIDTTAKPYMLDESPDGMFLYVSCYGSNNVRVIDRTADPDTVSRVIPVGIRPLHVEVSEDGQYIVTANQGSDDVTVIRTSDYSTSTISGVGHQPHDVDFTPDGRYLYVSSENLTSPTPPHHPTSGSKGSSFVTVIDFAMRAVIKRIQVGAWGQGMSITP